MGSDPDSGGSVRSEAPAEYRVRRESGLPSRIHAWVVIVVTLVMAADLTFLVIARQWLNAFLVLTIMGVILAPVILRDRLPVQIPTEMQLAALLFMFAALFLGEVRSYYERIWWWDIALHVSSGLLLGSLGFLLVYVLNESRNIELHLKPRFLALFAFLFAVAIGALWEIFEFTMDQVFGMNMQKPMLDDPSGLTDTMWDLIVDALGAGVVSVLGWWYLSRAEESFIERWIREFVTRNPRLFQ